MFSFSRLIIDYIDRGTHSLEIIVLLLALKVLYPKNIFLQRGNHERPHQTRMGAFYVNCLNLPFLALVRIHFIHCSTYFTFC